MSIVGTSETITASSSTGGSIAYSIDGVKPQEVDFNSSTGELTYREAVINNKTITIKATSSNGATATTNIDILTPVTPGTPTLVPTIQKDVNGGLQVGTTNTDIL
jgi:hypothetical protein